VSGLLVHGAGAIATLADGLRRGAGQRDAAVVGPTEPGEELAVATWDDRILATGPAGEVGRRVEELGFAPDSFERLDARGGLVTPGLIDSHTHLIYAGTREAEWRLRAEGAGYLEIMAAGGGILSTVAATRAATDEDLLAGARDRLARMLACGTTTVEAKSGYALTTEGELRLLELTARLDAEGPLEIVPTFMGAHAVPAEYRARKDAAATYVAQVVEEQLPAVAGQGIARFCDVFCEAGVFDADASRRLLVAAREAGLGIRLHADELDASGGAELAAELAASGGCHSADHLAAVSEAGIAALAGVAEAGTPVVATLLPATSWFLGRHRFAPARRLIEAGVPVALATDHNPGTSPTFGLPVVMSIACLELAMTPAEALAAVTVNAAHALGLGDRLGSIEPGKQADLVVWDVPSVDQIPYWLGSSRVASVVKRGRVVLGRA
jgi:imidazolonepropionase